MTLLDDGDISKSCHREANIPFDTIILAQLSMLARPMHVQSNNLIVLHDRRLILSGPTFSV